MKWIVALLLILAFPSYSEEVKPAENSHGCLMRFCDISGGGSTQYFVKVADDENDSEDGEAQIWGYDPLDVHKDKKGHVMFERALASDWIRAGGAGQKRGCVFHCPMY